MIQSTLYYIHVLFLMGSHIHKTNDDAFLPIILKFRVTTDHKCTFLGIVWCSDTLSPWEFVLKTA